MYHCLPGYIIVYNQYGRSRYRLRGKTDSMMVLTCDANTGVKSRCDPTAYVLVTRGEPHNYTGDKKEYTLTTHPKLNCQWEEAGHGSIMEGTPWEGHDITYVMMYNLNLITRRHPTRPSRGIAHANGHRYNNNINTVTDEGRLKACFRREENEERWSLNAMHDPGWNPVQTREKLYSSLLNKLTKFEPGL